MMTIRIPLRVLLFVLYTAAILAGAFGVSYAVFEWRDDESVRSDLDQLEQRVESVEHRSGGSGNDTSGYTRKLTATEAEAKVPAWLFEEASDWDESRAYALSCSVKDFNESTKAWVVECRDFGSTLIFRVYDRTGRVEWVQ